MYRDSLIGILSGMIGVTIGALTFWAFEGFGVAVVVWGWCGLFIVIFNLIIFVIMVLRENYVIIRDLKDVAKRLEKLRTLIKQEHDIVDEMNKIIKD